MALSLSENQFASMLAFFLEIIFQYGSLIHYVFSKNIINYIENLIKGKRNEYIGWLLENKDKIASNDEVIRDCFA